ncbi:MAG: hypothetical protein ACKVJK_18010, partial [Methylophagaceae bacterium]
LWQSGLNDPCPAGYRIPTIAELISTGGFLTLKITLAGYRLGTNGAITQVGSNGRYWSSITGSETARFLEIREGSYAVNLIGRSNGYSVRCIKN